MSYTMEKKKRQAQLHARLVDLRATCTRGFWLDTGNKTLDTGHKTLDTGAHYTQCQ
jgi:hypothetical protein